MAFSTTIGKTNFNIETKTGTNLIVQNNNVKSDGDDYTDPAAQFFVDTGTDNVNGNNFLYRFRPISQPTKYLAVSGSKVILKDIPNITTVTDSSHDFYVSAVPEDGNYVKYLYRYSSVGSLLYMSSDSNDDVILAGDSPKAWFRLREVPITNVASVALTASMSDYLVGLEYTEKIYSGTTNSNETEEEAFYGKIVVSERISVSEE